MKNELTLNINGFECVITGVSHDIKVKLENDFDYFINLKQETLKQLKITVVLKPIIIPKNIMATNQTENSISYDVKNYRYNDYYGEAVTLINYKTENCQIYCPDEYLQHELIYILILSRSGKFMDSIGLHKIHACGAVMNNKNMILMMDSKGGKSSTFLELLRDPSVGIISDDTPVIDKSGNVRAFPLRVGIENMDGLKAKFPYISESNFYEFKRKKYSKKYLVSLSCFKNKVGTKSNTILVQGFRSTFDEPKIIKISKIRMFKFLTKNMIVGVGLPLIIEYFLENTLKDHLSNLKNLFSRTISAIKLLRKSETYIFFCSSNIVSNGQALKEMFDEK